MQKYCSFTDKSFFSIHLRQPGSVGRARHTFPAPKCIMSKGMRLLTVNRKTYSSNVGKWEMVRALTVTYKENSMHHNYFCCCVESRDEGGVASCTLYLCLFDTFYSCTACQIKNWLWHFPRTLLLWIPICDNILSTVSDNALSTIFIHYKWKLV